jgi:hypothetical protein
MNVRVAHTDSGHQVGSSDSRQPASKALSLWVVLSLVLWGLIIGGIQTLL